MATVTGIDKAREAEVLMLEEIEHQVANTVNRDVGQHWGKHVGKKEACHILDTCYQDGETCWRGWPLPEGNHNPWEDEYMDVKGIQHYFL